jgi:molybdopterin synthase sulfur carrier subunit
LEPAFRVAIPVPDTASTPSTAITVRLVYLARLREAFGCSGEALALAGPRPTVGAALDALRAREGAWRQELEPGRAVRVAVNHELAALDARLREGDEVALLPPVTGG